MKKQQSQTSDANKETDTNQKATSDSVKNAHAAGDGALEKTDILPPDSEEKENSLKGEILRKEAEKY